KPKSVYLISPPPLKARKEILRELNYEYVELNSPYDVLHDLDVVYVTRIQKERFPDEVEYEKVKESYTIDEKIVNSMRKGSIILHPLPRVNEIDRKIDVSPHAKYFYQASLAVPIRQALFVKILGE
ncbi:aspartate carbamoyltransferase, partial [Acidianus sp. DSM 29099]|nr:aspartate carbamoyltransferase [Acidianus sp. RZ1]